MPPSPPYTWSQLPSFTEDRKAVDDDVSDWDLFQWSIEDLLCESPRVDVEYPIVESLGDDTDLFVFRTSSHPGLSGLPALVVVFRIDREPTEDEAGLLEGHKIFRRSDLGHDDDDARVLPFLE